MKRLAVPTDGLPSGLTKNDHENGLPDFVSQTRRTTNRRTFSPIWPESAACAASITLHVDAQTIWRSLGMEGLSQISLGEFGARVGVWRYLDLLEKHDLRATFFIPGWVAVTYPDIVKTVASQGHEVAYHGYHHTATDIGWTGDQWDPMAEEATLDRGVEILTELSGRRPRGYSFRMSPTTIDLLLRKGFLYSNSFQADDIPYYWMRDGRALDLLELPFDYVLTDSAYYLHTFNPWRGEITSPEIPFQSWQAEFDGAHEFGRYFLLVNHPQWSGRASRIAMLDRLFSYFRSFSNVWFATCLEVAEYWRSKYPADSFGE